MKSTLGTNVPCASRLAQAWGAVQDLCLQVCSAHVAGTETGALPLYNELPYLQRFVPCWPQAQPAAAAKKVNSYQASRAAEAEFERIIKERSGGKLPSLELRSSTAVRRTFNRSFMLAYRAFIISGTS